MTAAHAYPELLVTALLGIVGLVWAVARWQIGRCDTRASSLTEEAEALEERVRKQELTCAKTTGEVLTRLTSIEKQQTEENRKLDFLVGWARKNGSDGGGGDD